MRQGWKTGRDSYDRKREGSLWRALILVSKGSPAHEMGRGEAMPRGIKRLEMAVKDAGYEMKRPVDTSQDKDVGGFDDGFVPSMTSSLISLVSWH